MMNYDNIKKLCNKYNIAFHSMERYILDSRQTKYLNTIKHNNEITREVETDEILSIEDTFEFIAEYLAEHIAEERDQKINDILK